MAQPPGRGIYLCPKCRKPMRRLDDLVPPRWECSTAPVCSYTQADDDGRPAPPPRVAGNAGAAGRRPENPSQRPVASARVGDHCPDCGKGFLVLKTLSRTGKPFIGCTRFPRCRFFSWPGN